MTRTGTLAFSRTALLATLVGWAGVALAQSSTQTSRASGRWEAQTTSDHQPSFRRADSSASEWQPTRSERTPHHGGSASQAAAPPKKWLAPTQAAGRGNAATAKSSANKNANQSAARVPKPFVPPADAEQLIAADRLVMNAIKSTAPATAQSRPRANADSSAAQVSQSADHANYNPGQNAKVAPRSPHDRVAYRPRPTPAANRNPTANRRFDDSWIRPLKQVAYQAGAGEPEELYAPPGEESQMSMPDGAPLGPELQSEGEWIGSPDGVPYDGSGCDGSCGPDCEGGPMCGAGVGCCSTCGHDSESCSCHIDLAPGLRDAEACEEIRFRVPKIYTLTLNGGVHGFKGPFDQDRDSGNFGFQEGINMGAKVPLTDFGYQIGYQATQSQLSGDGDTGLVNGFPQHYLTAGVFQRNRDGFQGGVAWDWMLDERNTTVIDFSQVRAEFGFVDCGCHEVGGMVALHLTDYDLQQTDEEETISTTFQSADQFLLYYRMHGKRGGEGRMYAGLSDDSNGIVGADFFLPLTECWSLQPAFTYLIPEGGSDAVGAREEAWNIGINLVWHWKGQARSCHSSPYRPLFNVADNGYMIIDHRP